MRININLAAESTAKVIKKSTNPSANNEEICKVLSASANSLAKVDAIELPKPNKDGLNLCALPMTKVTAMVSPNARPSPSMMPPITPARV